MLLDTLNGCLELEEANITLNLNTGIVTDFYVIYMGHLVFGMLRPLLVSIGNVNE